DVADIERHRSGDITIDGATPRRITPGTRALTCPVRALDHWLAIAGIEDGPVFRPISRDDTVVASRLSDRAVARVVARTAERAGPPPGRNLAAHSLRAGFIQAALAAGIPEREVARHAGLAPAGTTLTGYARRTGKVADRPGPLRVGLRAPSPETVSPGSRTGQADVRRWTPTVNRPGIDAKSRLPRFAATTSATTGGQRETPTAFQTAPGVRGD